MGAGDDEVDFPSKRVKCKNPKEGASSKKSFGGGQRWGCLSVSSTSLLKRVGIGDFFLRNYFRCQHFLNSLGCGESLTF